MRIMRKSVLAACVLFLLCPLLSFPVRASSSEKSTETVVRAQLEVVDDDNKDTTCGIPYHQHIPGVCYDSNGELTCDRVVHIHVPGCYEKKTESAPESFWARGIQMVMPSVGGGGVYWIYGIGAVILVFVGVLVFRTLRKNKGKHSKK